MNRRSPASAEQHSHSSKNHSNNTTMSSEIDKLEMQSLMIDTTKDGTTSTMIPNGNAAMPTSTTSEAPPPVIDFLSQALRFLFCFTGLQLSYLTWGYVLYYILYYTAFF